jgi:hypothetical protein
VKKEGREGGREGGRKKITLLTQASDKQMYLDFFLQLGFQKSHPLKP